MKKTEKYGLNQWEASDRIRMEDFNGDNAALEAALAQKTGRMELIASKNDFASGAYTLGMTLRTIQNWGEWERVILLADFHKTTFLDGDGLRIGFGVDGGALTSTANLKGGSLAAVLFPRHDAASPIQSLLIGNGSGSIFGDDPHSKLATISFIITQPDRTIPTTKFVSPAISVYGIR